MTFFAFSAFNLCTLVAIVYGQCSYPSAFSGGMVFELEDGTLKMNLTSATGGNLQIGPSQAVFVCNGNTSTRHWGTTTVFGTTVGLCLMLQPTHSSRLVRFTYRTNVSSVGLFFTGNMLPGVTPPTTQSQACNAGGDRPEFEHLMVDKTVLVTPTTCPSGLQQNFTNYIVDPLGAAVCGGTADFMDGLSSSTSLSFNTGSCTQASNVVGTGMLHCLNMMTLNSYNFLWLTDALSGSGNYYCASYATSGTSAAMSITRGGCDASQSPSTIGSGTAAVFQLTTPVPTTTPLPGQGSLGPGTGGSGAEHAIPSLLLFLTTAIYRAII